MSPPEKGASVAREPRIWLVLHPSDSKYEERLRATLKREAAELGVELIILRTKSRKLSAEGERSRAVNILEPIDANQLYRDLSRHKCFVLSRGSVFVLHDPRRDPPKKRDCIPLQRFVDHRAVYRTLETGVDTVAEVRTMIAKGVPFDCTTYNDPRVLPLHVFDRDAVERRLETDADRSAFRKTYALSGGCWQSAATGIWRPAPAGARHGFAGPSWICNYELPPGYHWDVNAGRLRRTVIATASVWKVDPQGYVNIYPDSYIRAGSRAKEWQARR